MFVCVCVCVRVGGGGEGGGGGGGGNTQFFEICRGQISELIVDYI